MDERLKERIAMSLKVKPEEVPDDPAALKELVERKRKEYLEVKHG